VINRVIRLRHVRLMITLSYCREIQFTESSSGVARWRALTWRRGGAKREDEDFTGGAIIIRVDLSKSRESHLNQRTNLHGMLARLSDIFSRCRATNRALQDLSRGDSFLISGSRFSNRDSAAFAPTHAAFSVSCDMEKLDPVRKDHRTLIPRDKINLRIIINANNNGKRTKW